MKKQIRLTEEDLHFLVEDTVRNILVENGYDEGALWNAFKQKGQQIGQNMTNKAQQFGQNAVNRGQQFGQSMANKVQQFGQGANNIRRNMANTYQTGRFNKQLQKQAYKTLQSVNDFISVAGRLNIAELVKAGQNFQAQVKQTMQNSQNYLQDVQNNTFNYRS